MDNFSEICSNFQLSVPEKMVRYIMTGGTPMDPFEVMVYSTSLQYMVWLIYNGITPNFDNMKSLMRRVIDINNY